MHLFRQMGMHFFPSSNTWVCRRSHKSHCNKSTSMQHGRPICAEPTLLMLQTVSRAGQPGVVHHSTNHVPSITSNHQYTHDAHMQCLTPCNRSSRGSCRPTTLSLSIVTTVTSNQNRDEHRTLVNTTARCSVHCFQTSLAIHQDVKPGLPTQHRCRHGIKSP